MNILLYHREELRLREQEKFPTLLVRGGRAEHLRVIQKVTPGRKLRVGELDGPVGVGTVQSVREGEILLEVEEGKRIEQQPRVSLILALPRPQMLKRILETVATMGVSRIMLIRSEHVEKSYFQSRLLKAEALEEMLWRGLEQGVGTVLPRVSIHPHFLPFLEDVLPAELTGEEVKILADPGAEYGLSNLVQEPVFTSSSSLVFAIGPERGWNEFERNKFCSAKFRLFHLGEKVLRVETAVCVALSQLNLLRDLAGKD